MKRFATTLVVLCIVASLISGNAHADTIVYITDTGSKYHNVDCRYLSESSHSIQLSDAIKRGYEPCTVCHAPNAGSSHEHSWDNGTVTKVATCSEPGIRVFTCTGCRITKTENIPVNSNNHVWKCKTVVDQPIGAEHGYGLFICDGCGKTKNDIICPAAKFTDVNNDWSHKGIDYCCTSGLMNGMSSTEFSPGGSVTRAQLVTILYRYAGSPTVSSKNSFLDVSLGKWYSKAIEWAAVNKIVNGVGNGQFNPEGMITREQIATILYRFSGSPKVKGDLSIFPDNANASNYAVQALIWATGKGYITGTKNQEITVLAPQNNATRAQIATIIMRYGQENAGEMESNNPKEPDLAYNGESYSQKCERIFGEYVSDPRTVYTSDAAARPNMVTITVPAWDIDSKGQKYTRQFSLTVHRNIAATVDQIFREIYACPAKYPIHSLGGYRFDDDSEHTSGLAIDINSNENYYCSPSGQALVGEFFSPSTSEYSIPVGGEIDQIFSKYGFTRGIYSLSGYKDYKHYSFYGT